jgi:hypothetical protein
MFLRFSLTFILGIFKIVEQVIRYNLIYGPTSDSRGRTPHPHLKRENERKGEKGKK